MRAPRNKPPFLKVGETVRIVAMAGMMVLVIGIVWRMKGFVETPPHAAAGPAPLPAGAKPPAPPKTPAGGDGDVGLSPGLTSEMRDRTMGWDPAYVHVLVAVKREPEKYTDEKSVWPKDPWDLWRTPNVFRGKAVHIEGKVCRVGPLALNAKQAKGFSRIWEGQLADDRNGLYSFLTVEEPRGIREGDRVALNGVFLKVWAFINNDEDDVRTPEREDVSFTPLLVGPRLTVLARAVPPSVPQPTYLGWVAAGVFVLGGAVFALASLRERRGRRDLAKELATRHRAHAPREEDGAAPGAPAGERPE
jgi:hypothetical protein